MANLTITAASVLAGSNVVTESGIAGEAITAGQVVFMNPATKRFGLADSNSATAAARVPRGIALNSAAAGQPLSVARNGDITLGAVLTAGTAYYLSDTPGGICPVADVGSGEYVVLLGLAKSASVLGLSVQATGVAL
ncbi:hypothetical protein [Xanthobacter sediminis]